MILKLKRTPGIYLVGFMACGKTTAGRMLADELGWNFTDIDQEIEAERKQRITEIFDTVGEAAFRDLEAEAITRCVRSVERGRPTVVALGGGAFAQERNQRMLNDHGVVIWIDCPFDLVRARVAQTNHRPLARSIESLEKLYEERRPIYERAEYHIATAGDSALVVQAILKLPIF